MLNRDENSNCEFSSLKSQQISVQPPVDGKSEKSLVMSTLKTNMPLTLSRWYLYNMGPTRLSSILNKKSIECYPFFLISRQFEHRSDDKEGRDKSDPLRDSRKCIEWCRK